MKVLFICVSALLHAWAFAYVLGLYPPQPAKAGESQVKYVPTAFYVGKHDGRLYKAVRVK